MGISRCNYAIQPATRKSPPLPFHEEGGEDPLTHAGTGRHCRTCRARGRTRVWPVDRSSRSRRSRRSPPLSTLRPFQSSSSSLPPLNRTKTSSARRDDSRGMKNTVVQGLAEVPGSFLPSCPHVSTHEAPCRRKGKIKDRELSFLSERGSISGHRTAAAPLSWDTLNRVQKVLDSFESGEKRILKRDSGWGLVVFFFFTALPFYRQMYMLCIVGIAMPGFCPMCS